MVLFTKAQRRRISLWMVSMGTVCNTSAAVTDVYRIEWNHLCCKPTLRVWKDQNTCTITRVNVWMGKKKTDGISKEFNHDKGSSVYWIIQLDNSATWEGHWLEARHTTGPPYQTTLILTQSPLWTKKTTLIFCSCELCPAPLHFHNCELHLLKLPPPSQSICNQFIYNLVLNIFHTRCSYIKWSCWIA